MSDKPVQVRVAEKIASAVFDDEERGFLFLLMNQGQTKQAAEQEQGPVFDQQLYDESLKLAHEDPQALAELYAKTAAKVPVETVQAIEKFAQAQIDGLKAKDEQFKQAAFLQGVYQYEGFKYAAAQDQAQTQQTKTAQNLAEKSPALAAAAQSVGV